MHMSHNLPDYKHKTFKLIGDLCKKAKETNNLPVKRWTLVETKCSESASKKEALICSYRLPIFYTRHKNSEKNISNQFFQF